MRILRLGNSADVISTVPEEGRALRLVEQLLAERTGEPVETVFRRIEPRPTLPAIAARWAAEHRPDVVLLILNQFWYAYPSAPNSLTRFGWPGKMLARLAYRATRQQWLVQSRLFRATRRQARRRIGAVYLFEPEEVAARIGETLDRLRTDFPAIAVCVWSEPDSVLDAGDALLRDEINLRRRALHAPLREHCAAHGIPHYLCDEPDTSFDWPAFRDPDGMHLNDLGQRWVAENQARLLIEARTQDREPTKGIR